MVIAPTPTRPVKTADNVFTIIDILNHHPGATNEFVANEADLGESTTYAYLSTLVSKEYVVKEGNQYYLGLKFLDCGTKARDRLQIKNAADPVLTDLADETNGVAWLITEEFGRAVYLLCAIGERGIQTSGRVGKRTHLHCLAAGKAILAHMKEVDVRRIIEAYGLPPQTDETITDREALFEDLQRIRDNGIAYNREEEVSGIVAVGAPVICEEEIVAGISVSAPKNRMTQERLEGTVTETVLAAANELELRLTYS